MVTSAKQGNWSSVVVTKISKFQRKMSLKEDKIGRERARLALFLLSNIEIANVP